MGRFAYNIALFASTVHSNSVMHIKCLTFDNNECYNSWFGLVVVMLHTPTKWIYIDPDYYLNGDYVSRVYYFST